MVAALAMALQEALALEEALPEPPQTQVPQVDRLQISLFGVLQGSLEAQAHQAGRHTLGAVAAGCSVWDRLR